MIFNRRAVLATTFAMVLGLSGTAVSANEIENFEKPENDLFSIEYNLDDQEDEGLSFDDLSEFIADDASEEDIEALQDLYERIQALEEMIESLGARLDDTWDDIMGSGLIEDEFFEEEDFTFDMLAEEFMEDISDEDLAAAEALFNEAMALEEAGDYDEAEAIWDALNDLDIYEDVDEEFTFDMLAEEFIDEISDEDLAKAEELFNEAMALEEAGDYQEAEAVWEVLDEMEIFDLEDDYDEEFTFDMLAEEFIDEISDEDLAKAEELFNEAMALEEAGDYEGADDVWEALEDMDIFDWEDEYEEDFSFDELKEEFGEDLDEELLVEAEELFNEAMTLEEAGDYEAAEEKWEALFELDVFEDDEWDEDYEEEFGFEELRDELRDDLDEDVLDAIEDLFNEALELEESGDYDEADEKWNAIFEFDVFDDEDWDDEDWDDEDWDDEDWDDEDWDDEDWDDEDWDDEDWDDEDWDDEDWDDEDWDDEDWDDEDWDDEDWDDEDWNDEDWDDEDWDDED